MLGNVALEGLGAGPALLLKVLSSVQLPFLVLRRKRLTSDNLCGSLCGTTLLFPRRTCAF